MEEVMGKIVVNGKATKTGLKSSAYQQVGAGHATHLRAISKSVVVGDKESKKVKTIETSEFLQITENMVIKKIKVNPATGFAEDSVGETIHYSEIVPDKNYQYKCIVGGVEYMVESQMFSKVAFMRQDPSGKGTHYRCSDGMYIQKDEVQVPAYKKVELPSDHDLIVDTKHNNKHYVQYARVNVNGRIIEVPRSSLQEIDGKLYCKEKDSTFECKLVEYFDRYINYVLLDDDKIVKIENLKAKPNGEYVAKIGEEEVSIFKPQEVQVGGLIVESSKVVSNTKMVFKSENIDGQRKRMRSETNVGLVFTWPAQHPGPDGLVRLRVNQSRSAVWLDYADGRKEIYAKPSFNYEGSKTHKINWVRGFTLTDLGEEGIKFDVLELEKSLATDVIIKDNKITSYKHGDSEVSEIKWENIDGFDVIVSYKIDGVQISDIEWNASGQISRCRIGDREDVITNIEYSQYSKYAIKCKKIEKIEGLKFNEDQNHNKTISFTIGDYKITDAEYDIEQRAIRKCKVQKLNGPIQTIEDLSADSRFEHLHVAVKVAFDERRIKPLIESRLMEKIDGKYQKVADVVQTGPIDKSGVASAEKLDDLEQAVEAQKKFEEKKYPTWVMDGKGNIHQLNDVNTTYSGISEFECESDYFKELIGKDKLEAKNGDIKIDPKREDNLRNNQLFVGLALCSNFLTMPIGICILAAGIVTTIAAPIRRAIKERKLKKLTLEDVVGKTRERAKENCHKNIKKIEKEFRKRLAWAEKHKSSTELTSYKESLSAEFMTRMSAEAAKMAIFGEGALDCQFDLSKKTKINTENMLGWYAGKEKRREFIEGKRTDPRFESKWKELFIEPAKDEIKQAGGATTKQSGKIPHDWEKAIEVLETYGGRKEQILAHKIRMEHIDELLEDANKHLTAGNKLDKETFRNHLNDAFNAGRLKWGSIEDKLDVVKQSEAYAGASPKERKQMLEDRRKELMKQADNIKVKSAEIDPQYDKNNNLMSDVYGSRIMTRASQFAQEVIHGDSHAKMSSFDMDHDAKLSTEEQEMYGSTLSEQVCHRSSGSILRRMHHDEKVAKQSFEQVKEEQQSLDDEVIALRDRTAIAIKQNNHELAYILQAEIKSKKNNLKQQFDQAALEIDGRIHGEFTQKEGAELSKRLNTLAVASRSVERRLETVQATTQKEYEKMVQYWANEEFAATHPKEFKVYVEDLRAKAPKVDFYNEKVQRGAVASFASHMLSDKTNTNEDIRRDIYQEQMDMLLVKHNIEESVVAEVYCEQEGVKAKFEEYCMNNPSLKPEEAQVWFYSMSKREDAVSVEKFKKANKDIIDERAVDRFEEGKLQEHEKKDRKFKLFKGKAQGKAEEKQNTSKEEVKDEKTDSAEMEVAPLTA